MTRYQAFVQNLKRIRFARNIKWVPQNTVQVREYKQFTQIDTGSYQPRQLAGSSHECQ